MDFKEKFCGPEAQRTGTEQPHFPRSVCEGHWINSPNEHEAHLGESLVTQNHEAIVNWANERNGMPATVPGTEHEGRPGVLRFDIPGFGSNQTLEHVSWSEWFDTFDERQLVMLFQEHLRDGRQSNFFHLNSPFRENE
jgi:hypothetical protein